MQNIAILVGIADAQSSSYDKLPCCLKDVDAIYNLLDSCGKYERIETLKDVTADQLRDKIREIFLEKTDVGELLFFYSGHGLTEDEEFYFVLNEFSRTNKNSTGMSRTELHSLLRDFSAKVTVTVLDACNSGVNLIKSANHPLATGKPFDSFYQFAACNSNQKASGGHCLSVFTDGFIEAAVSKENGVIYYSDLLIHLRDIFETNTTQSPYFIAQSGMTDVFCDDGEKLERIRKQYTNVESENGSDSVAATSEASSSEKLNPVDTLSRFEKSVPSQGVAQELIDSLFNEFKTSFDKLNDTKEFFELRSENYNDYGIVNHPQDIVDTLISENRLDRLVTAEKVRKKKRRWGGGATAAFYDIIYGVENDVEYSLINRSDLERVHS